MSTRRKDLRLPGNGGRFTEHTLGEADPTSLDTDTPTSHPTGNTITLAAALGAAAQDVDMTTSPASQIHLDVIPPPNAPEFLHAAIELAASAHHGQTDKQGRDYFDAHLRPIADALRPFGPEAEALGWLHDIDEDTDTTLDDLRDVGQPEIVVTGVGAVTRQVDPRTGRLEPYPHLIFRSAAHPLGRLGKLADNTWNIESNHGLSLVNPAKAASLLHGRYIPARKTLLAGSGLTGAQIHAMQVTLRHHLARLAAQDAADTRLIGRAS